MARLRVVGVSDTATQKQEIQALVRLIVTYRDGGCVLRGLRHCGGEALVEDGEIVSNNIIQADHLITRANSATFADTRLIVCLCKNCHMWKKYNEKSYDKLVRATLPNDRKNLWDKCEEDRHSHKTWKPDWNLAITLLEQELRAYMETTDTIKQAARILGGTTSKKKAIASRKNGKLGGYHKWKKNLNKQNAQNVVK